MEEKYPRRRLLKIIFASRLHAPQRPTPSPTSNDNHDIIRQKAAVANLLFLFADVGKLSIIH
jgi:hypothetical protein